MVSVGIDKPGVGKMEVFRPSDLSLEHRPRILRPRHLLWLRF